MIPTVSIKLRFTGEKYENLLKKSSENPDDLYYEIEERLQDTQWEQQEDTYTCHQEISLIFWFNGALPTLQDYEELMEALKDLNND